jgi:hypothetical protein
MKVPGAIHDIPTFRRRAVETRIEPPRLARTSLVPDRLPPHVFHLAEEANLPLIQQYGLLSASALLDLAGIQGEERIRLERRQRLTHVTLPNGLYLRDQKPMPSQALSRCLIGMDPTEWYELINSKVFFWLDPDRLNRQRRACEPRPQVVLVVDTGRLLDRHAERVSLSPFNTGNARRKPALRGPNTFVPYTSWRESAWENEAAGLRTRPRPRSHRPVELTVDGTVPDIMELVIHADRLAPGESLCNLAPT